MSGPGRTKRALRGKKTGAVMVEMALLLPLLLVLTAAAIDMGQVLYSMHRIHSSAQDAARKAVATRLLTAAARTTIQTDITNYLNKQERLSLSAVTVAAPALRGGDGINERIVTVQVTGVYNSVFLGIVGIPTVPLDTTITMRFEWQSEAII